MGTTNVLLQAPLILGTPRVQCSWSKRLGLSPFCVACFPSFVSPCPVSVSSVLPGCFDRFVVKLASRPSFLVRAESDPGGESEAVEVVEEVGEEVERDARSEVEEQPAEEPKPPRKPRVKLGDIMGILNKKAIETSNEERPTPDLRTGDIVEIKLEVPENRRRLSVYKGIVMSKQNAGIHTTIRVRRIIAGCGVEIVFPVYSPSIKEIKVVKHRKVRRARLYYLRDKLPRLSTFN